MDERPLNRRRFFKWIGSIAGAAMAGCMTSRPSLMREEVAKLLGLGDEERAWLADLSQKEIQRLHSGLIAPAMAADDAATVMAKLLEPRSRLSAFVTYPRLGDELAACNGLIRH